MALRRDVAAGLAACALGLLAPAAMAQGSSEDPLSALAWLAGCWQPEGGEAGSTEQWMAPAAGVMLGMARTVKGGRVVEHEFLQIRRQPDGTLAYIALPSHQRLTTFAQKTLTPTEAVFENPTHDFPQRVIYRRVADDRLAARIEGLRNGTLRGIDFPMKRARCDGPP